jgi:hypothetical protein
MPIIVNAPLHSAFYPTNWNKFTTADPWASVLKKCGVTPYRADIYRWASRYRIAKSFRGVVLDAEAEIHPETEQLLDAIMNVFLVYSSFEQFCTKVLLLKMNEDSDLKTLEANHGPAAFIAKIRASDPDQKYAKFLAANLDEKPAARMQRFINGEPCNVCFFGKAIRHVFAHGALTPSSGKTAAVKSAAQPAVMISKIVEEFLLPLTDNEFNIRIVGKL